MADALKTFKEGEDILASETNENNQFLLSKLSDNAAQVQSYVEGEVASIKSNVASVQATLQNNIDEVANSRSIYITECSGDGENGYVIHNNGLCEQWGQATSSPVVFSKPYKAAPNIQIVQYDNAVGPNNNPTVRVITSTNFTFYSERKILWRSIGYVTV